METKQNYAENLLFSIFNMMTNGAKKNDEQCETVKQNKKKEQIEKLPDESKAVEITKNVKEPQIQKLKAENDQKITMQDRKVSIVVPVTKQEKICPVKVLPSNIKINNQSNSNEKNIKKNISKEEEHRLMHFVEHLRSLNVNFNSLIRNKNTGLYELNIVQNNGNNLRISADITGLLYDDNIKFFINPIANGTIVPIKPGDEYSLKVIYMTKESMEAIVNCKQIPTRFFIPNTLFNLNRFLDLKTLKENNPKNREKVFELAAKVLSDDDIINGIMKATDGKKFRFAFCRYMNNNEFSIVSSKRNKLSGLSKEKLKTSKEVWINIKDKNVELTTKDCK